MPRPIPVIRQLDAEFRGALLHLSVVLKPDLLALFPEVAMRMRARYSARSCSVMSWPP
jgi:hypothetical protein